MQNNLLWVYDTSILPKIWLDMPRCQIAKLISYQVNLCSCKEFQNTLSLKFGIYLGEKPYIQNLTKQV